MCDLAFSNLHAFDNQTPERPVIENKVRDIQTSKLNMAFLGVCTCDRTPFMARPALLI